jgi:hypothetical protein
MTSVADPQCSIPDPDKTIFSPPDPGSGSEHFFIPDTGSYMKSGMQTYFSLASYAFRSKVLVSVIVKKFCSEMASILNGFFTSVFTSEDLTNVPTKECETNTLLTDTIISRQKVEISIDKLRSNSAPGPDQIPPPHVKRIKETSVRTTDYYIQKIAR